MSDRLTILSLRIPRFYYSHLLVVPIHQVIEESLHSVVAIHNIFHSEWPRLKPSTRAEETEDTSHSTVRVTIPRKTTIANVFCPNVKAQI